MPEHIIIGTQKAFNRGHPFHYEKTQIHDETIYFSNEGSQHARPGEFLVMRCVEGTWTACDSSILAFGGTLQCRQAVFRCIATDITKPGWYEWQTNLAADANNQAGLEVDWHGLLWAETRLP